MEELNLAEQNPELNPIKHCDPRIVISSQCVIKKYSLREEDVTIMAMILKDVLLQHVATLIWMCLVNFFF